MSDEPAEALGLTGTPRVLVRPPASPQRKKAVRPSERRRQPRRMWVTFSSADIPARLRALAERWEVKAPSGDPGISAVIEHLLLPQLAKAERGEIVPSIERRGGLWV